MLCRTLAIAAVLAATAAAAPSTSVTLITHEDASQAQYGQSLPSCVEYSNENTPRNRLGDTNDTTTVTNNCSYEVGVQAKRKLSSTTTVNTCRQGQQPCSPTRDMDSAEYSPANPGISGRDPRERSPPGLTALAHGVVAPSIAGMGATGRAAGARLRALAYTAGRSRRAGMTQAWMDVMADPPGARDYQVSPWAQGAHREGIKLSLAEVETFDALVAEIHNALSTQAGVTLPPADARPLAKVTGPEAALAKTDRLLRLVDALEESTEFDEVSWGLLEQRKVLVDKHRSRAPMVGEAPGPFGWMHADLQYRNILWADGSVSAVLDWDRIAVKPQGEEVARTAQVQFGGEHGYLDLDRVAAFVSGYRSLRPLPRADLADAVERLWWKRMSDFRLPSTVVGLPN